MSHFANTFPALEGGVVTQGHADYCRNNGHATNAKLDATGEPVEISERCPRCGDLLTAEYLKARFEAAEGAPLKVVLYAAWRRAVDRDQAIVDVAKTRAETEAAEIAEVEAMDFESMTADEIYALYAHANMSQRGILRKAWQDALKLEEAARYEAADAADAALAYIPRPGDVVTDNRGRLGIVTEGVRKSGIHKGRLGVQWTGEPCAVIERPSAVTPVDKTAVTAFAASLAKPEAPEAEAETPEAEGRVDGATETEANVVKYGTCPEATGGRHTITWSKVPGLIHNGEQTTPDHWRGYCEYCDETFLE